MMEKSQKNTNVFLTFMKNFLLITKNILFNLWNIVIKYC